MLTQMWYRDRHLVVGAHVQRGHLGQIDAGRFEIIWQKQNQIKCVLTQLLELFLISPSMRRNNLHFSVWNEVLELLPGLNVEPSFSSRISLPRFSRWSIVSVQERRAAGTECLQCRDKLMTLIKNQKINALRGMCVVVDNLATLSTELERRKKPNAIPMNIHRAVFRGGGAMKYMRAGTGDAFPDSVIAILALAGD